MNTPDDQIPLELLANIASRLLKGGDYATAARQALNEAVPYRINARVYRYRWAEVEKWLENRRRGE